ncbi:MAG: zinc-binding alcohol dehydrogenase [Myxococcales bacterium]|nr:MAG: zinc-binding alcohol dehydrogenase [Myxococcales bacterium]
MPRELWFTGPGRVELREAGSIAVLAPGQLRARALASGISQGTELLLFNGEGPTPFDPSLDAPGALTYPRRYGYAWVGEVTESRSEQHAPGTRVFGLLPHGDEHVYEGARARALPKGVPPQRAVLAANLETAVNVAWDAGITLGDEVVVLGGGVVGCLVGWLAKRCGAHLVRVVEPSAVRRVAALELGVDEAVTPEELAPSACADVVIEATGNPSCLARAIALARDEATIVVASFYGARVAEVPLGADFHRRRLTLRASQVSRLPPSRSAGWSFDRRFALVADLLQNPRLDALVAAPVPFSEAPAVYARLSRSPAESLQIVFDYAG